MRTNVTFYQYNCLTKDAERGGKDAKWAQEGRRSDAVQTQSRCKADAKQTQRDDVRTHRRSAQKHGRRRDAGGTQTQASVTHWHI